MKDKTNTLAIVSLILSFIFPLIALVLGIVSLSQIKKDNSEGRGLAIAAIIISVIRIILGVMFLILFGSLAYFGASSSYHHTEKCMMPTGVRCNSHSISSSADRIYLALENRLGHDVIVTSVNATPRLEGTGACETSGITELNNSDEHEFVLDCDNMQYSSGKKRWDIEFEYYYEDSSPAYKKQLHGELLAEMDR